MGPYHRRVQDLAAGALADQTDEAVAELVVPRVDQRQQLVLVGLINGLINI